MKFCNWSLSLFWYDNENFVPFCGFRGFFWHYSL